MRRAAALLEGLVGDSILLVFVHASLFTLMRNTAVVFASVSIVALKANAKDCARQLLITETTIDIYA